MNYRPLTETYPYLEVSFEDGQTGLLHHQEVAAFRGTATHTRVTLRGNGPTLLITDKADVFEQRLKEAFQLGDPRSTMPISGEARAKK